jgi:hypothetical protein
MKKLLVPLICLATVGLQAQTRLNGGIQTGLMAPTGDFADKKDGYGHYLGAHEGVGVHFGGHLDLNFTPNHQLRFHLDALGFAGKEQDIYVGGLYAGTRKNGFGIGQLGGDYVYNFTDLSRGGYFLAGMNLNRIKAKAEFSQFPDAEVTQSGKVGFRIGGGYTFNRLLSLEGHLNSIVVDKDGPDGLGYDALTFLGVSVVFCFGH